MQVNRLKTLALRLRNGYGDVRFRKEYGEYKDVSSICVKNKLSAREINKAREIEKMLHTKKVSWVCLWEDSYPTLLREIYDPPMILFYRGDFAILANSLVSIVGTRKMSSYGKEILQFFIPTFSNSNTSTVSGGAFGVDSLVHELSIQQGITTISVLGSDVSEPTPKTKQSLFNKIIQNGGLLISETIPGEPLRRSNFVKRNRIISGLSTKTVIIEAPIKSGALQTAEFAFNQNRDVYALVNSIFSKNSLGCNELVRKDIAIPILSTDDLVAKLANNAPYPPRASVKDLDNAYQKSIVSKLMDGPLDLDSLILHTKLGYTETIKTCSELELRNIIAIDGNKYKLIE